MQAYPLKRVKWSNEHIMTALFGILILYLLPDWLHRPMALLGFLVLLLAALLIDTIFNMVKRKQILCAVSSAVTAAILQILTPGIPLYGRLLGIFIALSLGKHIWGGTGKNPINPALTGLLLICMLFPVPSSIFQPSFISIIAILLSLPLIIFRPFAAIGFIFGMTAALFSLGNFSLSAVISSGVFFWGCIIITDPVTITPNPLIGGGLGLLGGFVSLFFPDNLYYMAMIILSINTISALLKKFEYKVPYRKLFFKSGRIKNYLTLQPNFYDLTGEENAMNNSIRGIVENTNNPLEILERIENNDVFGLGGAGFPAIRKIKTVIDAQTTDKHLIVNAVECDPGLLHDKWLLQNKLKEINEGIEILCKCLAFKSITLAVKKNKNLQTSKASHTSKRYILKQVPDYFPVGSEKFLIKEVLEKNLNDGVIPAKEGILVLNLQTVYAVFEAVCSNKRADSKFITIANMKKNIGYVAKVKLGSPMKTIIDSVLPEGGASFYGGGAMQCSIADNEAIIDKTTNFLAISDFPKYKESELCSHCGFCSLNCPSGLFVKEISALVDKNLLMETLKLNPNSCLQCGRCSSVCLAGRNLSNRIKIAKEYSLHHNVEAI